MRLIDADGLLTERMMGKYYHLPNGDIAIPIIDIKHAKTIDAVEVVRCRDCKWCREQYDTDGNVPYWICMNWDGGTDADGFCHEAERKTDETN